MAIPSWVRDAAIIIGSLTGILIGIALLTVFVLLPLYESASSNIGLPMVQEPPPTLTPTAVEVLAILIAIIIAEVAAIVVLRRAVNKRRMLSPATTEEDSGKYAWAALGAIFAAIIITGIVLVTVNPPTVIEYEPPLITSTSQLAQSLALLIATTIVATIAAILMEKANEKTEKRGEV